MPKDVVYWCVEVGCKWRKSIIQWVGCSRKNGLVGESQFRALEIVARHDVDGLDTGSSKYEIPKELIPSCVR
jgi:hypothetical protein